MELKFSVSIFLEIRIDAFWLIPNVFWVSKFSHVNDTVQNLLNNLLNRYTADEKIRYTASVVFLPHFVFRNFSAVLIFSSFFILKFY